jgi:hypothetical protein
LSCSGILPGSGQCSGSTSKEFAGRKRCGSQVDIERFFVLFQWDLGLNSGLCACKAVTLHLSQTPHPLFCGYFGDGGHMNYLPKLALNSSSLDLSLASS